VPAPKARSSGKVTARWAYDNGVVNGLQPALSDQDVFSRSISYFDALVGPLGRNRW
jgi:hypothetical protein